MEAEFPQRRGLGFKALRRGLREGAELGNGSGRERVVPPQSGPHAAALVASGIQATERDLTRRVGSGTIRGSGGDGVRSAGVECGGEVGVVAVGWWCGGGDAGAVAAHTEGIAGLHSA